MEYLSVTSFFDEYYLNIDIEGLVDSHGKTEFTTEKLTKPCWPLDAGGYVNECSKFLLWSTMCSARLQQMRSIFQVFQYMSCISFDNRGITKYLSLPIGTKSIPDDFLRGCSKFKQLILPEGIESIGIMFCQGTELLEHLYLPSTVKQIGSNFLHNSGVKKCILSDGIDILQYGSFQNCRRLEKIVLPLSIKTINYGCFNHCTSLIEIVMPEVHTVLGSFAEQCPSLMIIRAPKLKKVNSKHCKLIVDDIINLLYHVCADVGLTKKLFCKN